MTSSPAKKIGVDLITTMLNEAEGATNDLRLQEEITYLRQQLMPICLAQQKYPQSLLDIPKELKKRWDALFADLEAVEDRRIKERKPLIAGLRTDVASLKNDTPPDELAYLDSAAAHNRQESRNQFQALMDGDLTEMHQQENAARSGGEADQIARLKEGLKQPKPKPPPIVNGENMN